MHALARDELIDQRYRVVRRIGQGAWAAVYEGVDTTLDRPVAIKILNDHLVDNPDLRARFVNEAEATTRIDSPFVVGVYAVGSLRDGRPYIVMELLDGEDLGQRINRDGPLEEERAVELAINALSGLAHAHARGVLHRDIKPDNLVVVKSQEGDEVLKIVDLGISKLHAGSHESLALTRTNVVLGSPVYMSPEQARGTKHMDHRSDVFSLGVVLYEALTGRVPHEGDNFNDLMFKIALEDAPDPRTHKPDLNPELAAIIMQALTRDLDKRLQSASAFREKLLEWGAERGARIPPTPSSAVRMRAPPSSKRSLVVALDDDDDKEPTKQPKPRPEITETLVEGGVLVSPTLAEPSPFISPRRRLGVFVVLALTFAGLALLVIFQPWSASQASYADKPPAAPPPPATVVIPQADPTPAPVASVAAPVATVRGKPVFRAFPSKAGKKVLTKPMSSATPGPIEGQETGEETDEETSSEGTTGETKEK